MTPELANHLTGLAKLGLYGGSVSEVIRHLVKTEIRLLNRNWLVLLDDPHKVVWEVIHRRRRRAEVLDFFAG